MEDDNYIVEQFAATEDMFGQLPESVGEGIGDEVVLGALGDAVVPGLDVLRLRVRVALALK